MPYQLALSQQYVDNAGLNRYCFRFNQITCNQNQNLCCNMYFEKTEFLIGGLSGKLRGCRSLLISCQHV